MIRLLELRMEQPKVLVELLTQQLKEDAAAFVDYNKCERFCRDSGRRGEVIMAKLHCGFRLEDELVRALIRKEMQAKHMRAVDTGQLYHLRVISIQT
jgi:hypothetical protein